jgi:RHS repeat-associated protein
MPRHDALERELAKTGAKTEASTLPTPPPTVGRATVDPRGLVTCVEVEGGRRFGFERDAAGRVVAADGPGGRRTFERDSVGRVKTATDGSERTIRTLRDAAGRVESVSARDGASDLELTFEHDVAGRPTLASAQSHGGAGVHAVRWSWDAQGQLLAEEGPDGRLAYERSASGERVTTPWGALARRTDAAGRVTTLESPAGTFHFTHDADARVTRVRAPNGVVTDVLRDAAGREVRRTARGRSGPVLELSTARDASGRATTIARDGAPIALTRDARGRLTGARGAGLDLGYGWSAGGDRERSLRSGVRTDATHDGAGRLATRGDERFEHEGAGRVTRRAGPAGETRYGWDPLGRLSRVERRQGGASSVVTYGYDSIGRLATRTTSAGTTRYVHESDQLLAEVGPGAQVRVWVHAPGVDEPLAYGDGERWTYLHGDATATTLAYTDGAGAKVADAVIGPFGEVVRGPAQARTIAAPQAPLPTLFAGRPVDPDTGLVNLRARWYSPELGRFLDPDLLGLAGGTNPWLYTDGDPIERRDPTGLSPEGLSDVAPITERTHSPTPALQNSGPGLFARLWDGARVAVANGLASGERLLHRAQVEAQRLDFYDPTGTKPVGSTNTFDNLILHVDSAVIDLALTGWQKTLAVAHDVVAPDQLDTGAAQRAKDAAVAHAMAPFERMARDAELLQRAGHSKAAAVALAEAGYLIETLPVLKAYDAITGKDTRHFLDTGNERHLGRLERGTKGVQAFSETVLAVAPVLAPSAALAEGAALTAAEGRAATALAEEGLAARAATAEASAVARAEAAAARGPNKGLAQAIDPDAARGAASSEAAAGRAAAAEAEAAEAAAARQAQTNTAREAEARAAREAEARAAREAEARAALEAEARAALEAETRCFLAGTLVETLTGRRPIETIAVGDVVLSRNEDTGAYSWHGVRRLFPGMTRLVAHLLVATSLHGALDLQTIDCTPNHPIWRAGSGFVRADALRAGDVLSSPSGAPVVVASVDVVAQVARTWNFEVETDHTYFVAGRLGAPAIWAHNDCTLPTGEAGGKPTGPPTKVNGDIALQRENEAASKLAENGFRVEQNPKVTTNPDFAGTGIKQKGNPDYLIEGRVFDCYSPTTADPRAIAGAVAKKVNKGQAARIVLNLADSPVDLAALATKIQAEVGLELEHLQELIVVTRNGAVRPLYTR